ncbi:DUF6538 domain-containing protein [Kangsaoukella pontilimi]|uniref:DUF6538 domain-containing protein n=1 Tax=Kangsaoukella pontilimi TaxID=2691042 RepID=UPI001D0B8D33|nr:DUF6538 domain-containing protein [Kangsaoukella pontilimi]
MSSKIKYAYLKDQTWLYRRHYPADVAPVLGARALKRYLKTSDPKVAATRAAELNLEVDRQIKRVRSGVATALNGAKTWEHEGDRSLTALRAALGSEVLTVGGAAYHDTERAVRVPTVGELAERYLRKRAGELRPGGFKSVRYSVGLFSSKFGDRQITHVTREDGRWFVSVLPNLSRAVGKSRRTRGLGLEGAASMGLESRLHPRIADARPGPSPSTCGTGICPARFQRRLSTPPVDFAGLVHPF